MSANITEVDGTSTAVLDPTGTYRYQLTREVAPQSPVACWIMLNPSTADASVDDPTIRRVIAFSRSWGFGRVIVANLFALRSTDPRALRTHAAPIGPDNDRTITSSARAADLVVCAWGAHGTLLNRSSAVRRLLAGTKLHALDFTNAGEPRHPLYLRGDLHPLRWHS